MDNLITFLEDKASDKTLPIAIHAAAFNGLKIMKKYYALTDDSILPRCGISKSSYLIHSFAYAYVLSHYSMPPWPQDGLFYESRIEHRLDSCSSEGHHRPLA